MKPLLLLIASLASAQDFYLPATAGQAKATLPGFFYVQRGDHQLKLSIPFAILGQRVFFDTGERRLPLKGEWFFIIDANQPGNNTVYDGMYQNPSLRGIDPARYGILRVVELRSGKVNYLSP